MQRKIIQKILYKLPPQQFKNNCSLYSMITKMCKSCTCVSHLYMKQDQYSAASSATSMSAIISWYKVKISHLSTLQFILFTICCAVGTCALQIHSNFLSTEENQQHYNITALHTLQKQGILSKLTFNIKLSLHFSLCSVFR